MTYSEITFKDKNPVKRWLQKQRLVCALRAANQQINPSLICDFGAGNGELCKLLIYRYPSAKVICYEPTQSLLAEAKENLKGFPNIIFCQTVSSLNKYSVDLIFALEVFEHLPEAETNDALQNIYKLLSLNGHLIIGVPVEVGLPALYKGIFRMMRRYGSFDAEIQNVLKSLFGKPPMHRPAREISTGLQFHFEHVGFDYRKFREKLSKYYNKSPQMSACPFSIFGPWLMPEIYFTIDKVQ